MTIKGERDKQIRKNLAGTKPVITLYQHHQIRLFARRNSLWPQFAYFSSHCRAQTSLFASVSLRSFKTQITISEPHFHFGAKKVSAAHGNYGRCGNDGGDDDVVGDSS